MKNVTKSLMIFIASDKIHLNPQRFQSDLSQIVTGLIYAVNDLLARRTASRIHRICFRFQRARANLPTGQCNAKSARFVQGSTSASTALERFLINIISLLH
jgi:hypothetical protein